MNRSKKLYILLGILAVACVATFAVTGMEERKEQIKETGEIILELPVESVESLSWEYNKNSLAFHGAENYSITYEEESAGTYRDEDVYFTVQNGKNLPLDTGRVEDYLNYIEYLNLTDYVTYNATEEELSACGLDDPELTVTVNYTAGEEDGTERSEAFALHISRDPEEKKASKEKEGDGEEEITAYARVGDSRIIYQISSAGYKRLMAASYDDFRHLEVLPAAFEEIRQVDISLEGSSYTLGSEQDGKERTWSYQGEELEIDSIQSALNALTAEEFTTEKPSGKEEISLTLSLDREDAGEVQIQCRLDPDTAVE